MPQREHPRDITVLAAGTRTPLPHCHIVWPAALAATAKQHVQFQLQQVTTRHSKTLENEVAHAGEGVIVRVKIATHLHLHF